MREVGNAMVEIRLMVQPSREGMWQVSVGYEPWRFFQSQHAAILAATQRARTMSRDGIECEVVMKFMTCRFGRDGYFKALPTPDDVDWELPDAVPEPREAAAEPSAVDESKPLTAASDLGQSQGAHG
jgi:hypothetical protein